MLPARTLLLLPLFLFPALAVAQNPDGPASPDTARMEDEFRRRHEFGFNTTMLLKQVFNLSNSTFAMLPYDLTYKNIAPGNKTAWRFGLGISMDFSKSGTEITGGSPPPGPNSGVPAYSNHFNSFFRAGWERRFRLDRKFLVYAGVDLVGETGYSRSQTVIEYNNLPNSYNSSRTTVSGDKIAAGGGPVFGIQYNFRKRLSLYTEMPLYAVYSYEVEESKYSSYNIDFNGTITNFQSTEKEDLTGTKLSLTLPVTLYLAFKF